MANGLILSNPKLVLPSTMNLNQVAIKTGFKDFVEANATLGAYNFFSTLDYSGNNRNLLLGGDASINFTDRVMDFAGTGYARTPITNNSSFCALITLKPTTLDTTTRNFFGDYDENVLASTTGFRFGINTTNLTFSCKRQDGTANTSFSLAMTTSPLNKWKTFLLDVNRGVRIKIMDETGSTAISTDTQIINYVTGSLPLRFGRMNLTASLSLAYLIGKIASGIIINGTQSDVVHSQLLNYAKKDLTAQGRNFTYG